MNLCTIVVEVLIEVHDGVLWLVRLTIGRSICTTFLSLLLLSFGFWEALLTVLLLLTNIFSYLCSDELEVNVEEGD